MVVAKGKVSISFDLKVTQADVIKHGDEVVFVSIIVDSISFSHVNFVQRFVAVIAVNGSHQIHSNIILVCKNLILVTVSLVYLGGVLVDLRVLLSFYVSRIGCKVSHTSNL